MFKLWLKKANKPPLYHRYITAMIFRFKVYPSVEAGNTVAYSVQTVQKPVKFPDPRRPSIFCQSGFHSKSL